MSTQTETDFDKNRRLFYLFKELDTIIYEELTINISKYKRMAILVRHTTDSAQPSLPMEIHINYNVRSFRSDYNPFTELIQRLQLMTGLIHTGQVCYGLLTFKRGGAQ